MSVDPQPSTSTARITPQQLIPLPKAGPRKPSNRRKVKSAIITDTPEKLRLESEISERQAKKRLKRAAKKRICRKINKPATSSSEDEDMAKELLATDSDSTNEEVNAEHVVEDIGMEPGQYVLVKFVTPKRSYKYYIGEILSKNSEELHVKFMRKVKGSAASFAFPEQEDVSIINADDVILLLGQPATVIGTSSQSSHVSCGSGWV